MFIIGEIKVSSISTFRYEPIACDWYSRLGKYACNVIPLGTAVPDALAAGGDLNGRILIDATNPLSFIAGKPELAIGFSTSGGEEVACLAPGASVFKTMNQVGYKVMPNTRCYPARPVMSVAGDDTGRKPVVLSLVSVLGIEAVDAGPLIRARLLEPYAMLWIDQAFNRGAPDDNAFSFMRREKRR